MLIQPFPIGLKSTFSEIPGQIEKSLCRVQSPVRLATFSYSQIIKTFEKDMDLSDHIIMVRVDDRTG